MFDTLEPQQKYLVYRGLKRLIETKNGLAFHNSDLGHDVYRDGAEGREPAHGKHAPDGPDRNDLFKMLAALSADLRENTGWPENEGWYDFADWQAFCRFVIECHSKD